MEAHKIVNKPMFVKNKFAKSLKKKSLLEQDLDLDLDLTILLFNEWNKMLPIHIDLHVVHLSFEIFM